MFLQNFLKIKEKEYEERSKNVRKWANKNFGLWQSLQKGELKFPDESTKVEPFYHYLHIENGDFSKPIVVPPEAEGQVNESQYMKEDDKEEEIIQTVVMQDETFEIIEVELEMDEEEYNQMVEAIYKEQNPEKTEGLRGENQNRDTLECMDKLNQSAGMINLDDSNDDMHREECEEDK